MEFCMSCLGIGNLTLNNFEKSDQIATTPYVFRQVIASVDKLGKIPLILKTKEYRGFHKSFPVPVRRVKTTI